MPSKFVRHKKIESYRAISRFGAMKNEQVEIGLISGGKWIAFLNFRHPGATPIENHVNAQKVPEFFAPPEQYQGTIDILRNESPVWFTLYEDPLAGWIVTGAEPTGEEEAGRAWRSGPGSS